jgi:predicted transcriptional regulator
MLDLHLAIAPLGRDFEAGQARSLRRATARRASRRRAAARSRQDDNTARIAEQLGKHPKSTAGDLAKALNLNPEIVANCLNQLTKTGDIKKTDHGYSAQATPQRRSRRRSH